MDNYTGFLIVPGKTFSRIWTISHFIRWAWREKCKEKRSLLHKAEKSGHFTGETKENHEKDQLGWPVSGWISGVPRVTSHKYSNNPSNDSGSSRINRCT